MISFFACTKQCANIPIISLWLHYLTAKNMQLFNPLIVWQQCNSSSHIGAVQELQVNFHLTKGDIVPILSRFTVVSGFLFLAHRF